jgi:mRNA-degrading endonuclease YafQ of YafQ-DinJ toxin-antitoxin module
MKKAKKPATAAPSKPTPAISKPSCDIELTPRFLDLARKLSKAERKLLGRSIDAAARAWSHPHQHRGAGIRRLHGNFFECRCGLDLRLVFEWIDGALRFHLLGSHDEIRAFLKQR